MKEIIYKDIEEEQDELSEDLTKPFNPKDIDITVETRSLDSLISRIRHGEIDMNTHFQRNGDLWSNKIMSRLIESILIRFPLPAFYFDATDDDNWLIVDGLQRLSAIRRFVLNTDKAYVERTYSTEDIEAGKHVPLKLTGLEYLTEHKGKTFDELPSPLKRRINDAQITTYLVKPGTPEEVVYSVFYRINTGGLMLNAQEIRHALNQKGESPKYLEALTDSELFKKTVTVSNKRMQDRELALRFVAFKLFPYKNYRPSMVSFLNKVMKELNDVSQSEFEKLSLDFNKALKYSYQLFGEDAFSKSIARADLKNSLNRALFEIWTVPLSELAPAQLEELLRKKDTVRRRFSELLMTSDFDKSISISTTGTTQVDLRFSRVYKLIESILND